MITIELTKEEAQLLPLLYKVPINTTLEAAAQTMKFKLLVDGLLEKVNKALADGVEPQNTNGQKKRERH